VRPRGRPGIQQGRRCGVKSRVSRASSGTGSIGPPSRGHQTLISTHINGMREKLRAGELVLGTGITLSDPTVTEALARDVDFVWIDLEHNATTTEAMLGHLIASRAGGTASIVRIPNHDVGWIKRVLDSGAEGII